MFPLFTYPLIFVVSLVVLFRGEYGTNMQVTQWRWKNFFLGQDFVAASLPCATINLIEIYHLKGTEPVMWKLVRTAAFVVIVFCFYLVILLVYRLIEDIEKNNAETGTKPPATHWLIGTLGNVFGFMPLTLFLIWKLDGSL